MTGSAETPGTIRARRLRPRTRRQENIVIDDSALSDPVLDEVARGQQREGLGRRHDQLNYDSRPSIPSQPSSPLSQTAPLSQPVAKARGRGGRPRKIKRGLGRGGRPRGRAGLVIADSTASTSGVGRGKGRGGRPRKRRRGPQPKIPSPSQSSSWSPKPTDHAAI